MGRCLRILLQTTIPKSADDWSIERFSLLREWLASVRDEKRGISACEVVARDLERRGGEGSDPLLSALDESSFDEVWLFAVDVGDGLSDEDCAGITRFRQRGGGILATRDHQDLGSSLCTLGGVGHAHFFHTRNPDPDASRHRADDPYTKSITWPNYHSGKNGDYQRVKPVAPVHQLLRRGGDEAGVVEWFPAHPHEGAVGVPEGERAARVIATGESAVTGRPFNLAVVFERAPDEHGHLLGRAVAEASFHHFADYNWNPSVGAPSFVEEEPGDEVSRNPQRLEDIKTYTRNLALWLAPD